VENNLTYLIEDKKERDIVLYVHPYIESHFKRGIISKQFKWYLKFKKWVPVVGVTNHHLLQYTFKTKGGKVIDL
jgi:ribonuclease G